jgi:hypothetical protein
MLSLFRNLAAVAFVGLIAVSPAQAQTGEGGRDPTTASPAATIPCQSRSGLTT